MRRARRIALRAALGVVAVLVALAVFLLTQGSYETFGPSRLVLAGGRRPPAWTAPCVARNPKSGIANVLACARVEGRVVYIQRHDPDGDLDRHILVMAGLRPVVVKFAGGAGPRKLPGLGSEVAVVGFHVSDDFVAAKVRVGGPNWRGAQRVRR